MKKLLSIAVTLCALACAVGFWLVGGSGFLKMRAGSEAIGEERTPIRLRPVWRNITRVIRTV